MKGTMQTNRWTGYHLMDLHDYKVLSDPLFKQALLQPVPVPFNVHPSSPNQRADGIAVGLRQHAMALDTLSKSAFDQAISNLEMQRDNGHCVDGAIETLTGGHAPIWYRAQASGLITANEMVTKDTSNVSWNHLRDLYLEWWGAEIYLTNLLAVQGKGAVKKSILNCIVGVGARYDKGLGNNNLTRNVCWRLIRRAPTGVGSGFWINATKYQDEVAALLIHDLVRDGAFNLPKFIEASKKAPIIPFKLTVKRYERGHVSSTDRPLQGGDPTTVWVSYKEATIGDDDSAIPDMGTLLSTMEV